MEQQVKTVENRLEFPEEAGLLVRLGPINHQIKSVGGRTAALKK